jgi:glucokinase
VPTVSHAGPAIGVDIGATKIASGRLSFPSLDIGGHTILPTLPDRGSLAVEADVVATVKELTCAGEGPVSGIGIGVPEIVDLEGRIVSHCMIDWRGIDFPNLFKEIAPVIIDVDVRMAARAEAAYGAGRDYGTFAYLTIGSGISHTLVMDGSPYPGSRGYAALLVHSPFTTVCNQCGAKHRPIVEELASGPGLLAGYNQKSTEAADSAESVIARAVDGERVAMDAVRAAASALGPAIAFLVNVVDPEALVIGGGLGCAEGPYWDTLVQVTREHIWGDAVRDLPIVHAELGPDAGVVGAALVGAERSRILK